MLISIYTLYHYSIARKLSFHPSRHAHDTLDFVGFGLCTRVVRTMYNIKYNLERCQKENIAVTLVNHPVFLYGLRGLFHPPVACSWIGQSVAY